MSNNKRRTVPFSGSESTVDLDVNQDELYDLFRDVPSLPKRYLYNAPHDKLHKRPVVAVTVFQPTTHTLNPLLITGSEDSTAKVWDLYTMELKLVFTRHENKILAITSYAETGKVITGGDDGRVICWNPLTGEIDYILNENQQYHTRSISSLAIAEPIPQPPILVVGSYDKGFSVWDLFSGNLHYHIQNSGHTDLLLSLTCIHDYGRGYQGISIITGSWDKTIRIFGWNDSESVILKGHTKSVTTCTAYYARVHEKQCPVLITGSLDKTCILWDLYTKTKVRTFLGHEEKVTCVKVFDRYHQAEDGLPPLLISSSEDGSTIMWDLLTAEKLRVMRHHDCKVLVHDVFAASAYGMMVITGDSNCDISVWNMMKTERIRKFNTSAVTAIDFYELRPGESLTKPLVAIGAIDSLVTLFEFDHQTHRELPAKLIGHKTRINAMVIYSPPNLEDPPLVITCDGSAVIKVWNLFTFQEVRSLLGHNIAVFTIGLYDPQKCLPAEASRSNTASASALMPIFPQSPNRGVDSNWLDLNRPMIITGGIDKDLRIWDFLANDPKKQCLKIIPQVHGNYIRSIDVFHPETTVTSSDGLPHDPLYVTGSYDMTAKLWNLKTGECLRVFKGLHKGFVFIVHLYDPFRHLGVEHMNRIEPVNRCPMVITGGYDNITGVWNMNNGEVIRTLEGHRESVTALTLYVPKFADDDPLVITGSIDKMVIVWNLLSGERLQTLVGHTDRVCFLNVYLPPSGEQPLLFSGGDDRVTIVWEDALYQRKHMPVRDAVNRAFDIDLVEEDWPMITEMTKSYGLQVFVENTNLFYLAIQHDRSDFLLKFRKYLSYCLRFMKSLSVGGGGGTAGGTAGGTGGGGISGSMMGNRIRSNKNILSFAIENNNLIAVRAILLSWTEGLNRDINDILTQRLYHASYFFPEQDLKLLASFYPVEFVHFITSLRLIRNYESSSLGNQHVKLKLNPEYRYEITGVEDPAVHFDTAWTPHFFPKTGWCCSFSKIWSIIESFAYKRVEVPQSVTSMMLPLRKSSSLESLALFVEVSTALNNVAIFDSPVGIYSLHYFWDQHGRSTHLMNFAKYVISLATFILCLFANDFHYTASDRSIGDNVGVAVLNAVMIAMFAYYFYDEFGQCRSKYNQLQDKVAKTDKQIMAKNSGGAKKRLAKLASFAMTHTSTDLRASSFHAFLISHFLFDLWNAFDLVIVCTGIAGLSMRFIYNEDKPGGRVLFAITSVLMWFKTLYFMRPFAASGPLVAVILRILFAIRFYLIALLCVLTGFAQAFWYLANVDKSAPFGTVGKSMYNSFLTMLGAWTPDFTDSASPDFGSFLTCVMMMTIMIIMLNVLIALMGDTFSTARSMGLALWRKEQATVTFDQSFALSEDTIYVPPHIHVLQYTSDVAITVGTNNLVEMVEASKYHVMKFTDLENEEIATDAVVAAATPYAASSGDGKLLTVSQEQLEALFAKFLEAQGVNASSTVKRK